MRAWLVRFGQWLVTRFTPPASLPDESAWKAVCFACEEVGLNPEAVTPEMDLRRTGKLYEVLDHAAHHLGKDHELTTAKDVADWLADAPAHER